MDRKLQQEIIAALTTARRSDLVRIVMADFAADFFNKEILYKAVPNMHRDKSVKIKSLPGGTFEVYGPAQKVYPVHKFAQDKNIAAKGVKSEMGQPDGRGNVTVRVTVPTTAPKLGKGEWTRSQFSTLLLAISNAKVGTDFIERFHAIKGEPVTLADVEQVLGGLEGDIAKIRKVFERYAKQKVPDRSASIKVK